MSSQPDTSMSMNSLMQAIYGDHHTQYTVENEQHTLQQLPQFMLSLIAHLQQLCVTQGFADNVNRILQPWIRQVKINQKNPKSTIQGFLRDFLKLFEQQTQKINKYGQKKLKYLTQTVSKQIFTQIMRMACDLKLQSVNRTNHLRSAYRKSNNLTILSHCINKLHIKDKSSSFKTIKKLYYQDTTKQQAFVSKILQSLNNLNKICKKNKISKLWKSMSIWRLRNIEISQQQSILLYRQIKQFYRIVLPQIVKSWNNNPTNWLSVIIQNLSKLVQHIIGYSYPYSQGIQIQFIVNPNLQKQQQHNSLDYSALSSYRSVVSGISHISNIPIQQYLRNQQIKYDNVNKYLAIPIIAQQQIQIGLIKISWSYQLPIFVFNRTLKLVEMVKEIIQGFAKITTRLAYHSTQYQNNSWQQQLYELAIQDQTLNFKQFQKILQNAHINFIEIYHDKNIANSCIRYGKQNISKIPQNIYKIIWQKLQTISSFKLDRDNKQYEIVKLDGGSNGEGQGFCRYSFQQNYQIQSHQQQNLKNVIIKCIAPMLSTNLGKIGCKSCNIRIKQRDPKKQIEMEIDGYNQVQFELSQRPNYYEKNRKIKQINRQKQKQRTIKIQRDNQKQQQKQKQKVNIKQQFSYELMIKMRNVITINQAQNSMYDYLTQSLHKIPIYARLFYLVSQSKNLYAYHKTTNSSQIQIIQIPKIIINQNICTIQPTQRKGKFNKIITTMHGNPLFNQSQIYLYQKQANNSFKIYPKRIGRKALILLATYQIISTQKIQKIMNLLANQLNQNNNIFSKQNLYNWASKLLLQTQAADYCGEQFSNISNNYSNLITKQRNNFAQAMQCLMKQLTNVKKYYIWAIDKNKVVQVNEQNQYKRLALSQFPLKQLCQQPIKSHQNIKGSHKIIRMSKYYGQKLQQFFTYIPNFETDKQKLNYAEIICEGSQYEEMGECTDSRYLKIEDYLQKNYKLDKNMYQFISIPIKYSHKTYVIVLQYNRSLIISEEYFNAISKYINRIVLQTLQKRKEQMKRNCLLIVKSGVLFSSQKNKIKQVLLKFEQNKKFTKQRNLNLSRCIQKINYSIRYKATKQCFNKIKSKSEYIKNTYQSGSLLLVKRVMNIFGQRILINKIKRLIKINKSFNKLSTTLSKMITVSDLNTRFTRAMIFKIIKQYSDKAKLNKQLNKEQSSNSIKKIFSNIQKRILNQFFLKNIQNLYSLKRSLAILQQQFALVQPKSIKKCLQFLTGRLGLMLSQFCTTPLTVKIVNFSYHKQQSDIKDLIGNDRSICIMNSSFTFQLKSQVIEIKMTLAQKLIQQVLTQILPDWEISHRRRQSNRIHNLQKILQTIQYKNMRHIFSIKIAETNKQNISQYHNLQQKTNQQLQKLQQLQINCNSCHNLQNRQKHKKFMDQLKNETNLLQNQLYKVGVQMRIKSKTNAAYRMIGLMNRKSNENVSIKYQKQRKYSTDKENQIQKKLKQVQDGCQQDRFRYSCQTLPLWHAKINKIFKKNLQKRAKLFFTIF